MDTNYSLSDIASVAKENDGFGGGNSAWVLILLFAMIFGWGNGGFGGNGNALQQSDLQRAVDLNSIQSGQADIEARVQEVGAENISAIKDASYNNLSESRNIGDAVAVGFSSMQSSFCDTQRAIDSAKYDNALGIASVNSNIDNKFAAMEKSILEQRLADQAQQINQLQMAQAVCGIPRVNNFAWGTYPYGQTGCGCNGNL